LLITDRLVRAKPTILEALGGISRRTLHDYIKHGRFPKPDVPAQRLGAPDLWRESTVKRGLEAFAAASTQTPARASAPRELPAK
jgi:predicted DNA-binding transcriptional regulator AlpA